MTLSKIFRQSSIYFIGDAIRRTVGLFMLPVYTRYLNPAEYGTVELIELFVSVTTIVFGILALSDSMVRIYHQYGNSGKDQSGVISTALWCMAIGSSAITLLAFVFAEYLSILVLHTPMHAGLIRGAFAAMAFGNLVELILVYERMRQRAGFFVAFSIFQVLITVAFNIYFIVFAGMGVWGFVLSKLISTGAGAVFLAIRILREVKWKFNLPAAREMAHFGSPLILSSLSFFVIHFADRFFLGQYTTLSQVGIYALAYRFGFLVTNIVGEPFGRTWSVTLYSYTAEAGWREHFARVMGYLAFCLFTVATILSLFISELLEYVASPAYQSGAQLVPIIAFAYVCREFGDFFRGILFINKRSRVFSGITILCALLNTGLNFWLIPLHGAAGAAWATLLTWLIYMLSCWIMANAEHRVPYPVRGFAYLTVISMVVCGLGTAANSLPTGLQWGIDSALAAVFLLLVWGGGYFPVQERNRIKHYLSHRRHALQAMAIRPE